MLTFSLTSFSSELSLTCGCMQVKAACSKQRDDAALCSFALRSSSADIQVPFREPHISGHAAAVSDPGKGIEGMTHSTLPALSAHVGRCLRKTDAAPGGLMHDA